MNTNQEKIKKLLSNLKNADHYKLHPAKSEQIATFIKIATDKQVPHFGVGSEYYHPSVKNNTTHVSFNEKHCI
jgi:hypothetical protein